MISRRVAILGLFAAPAIVRASSLMAIRPLPVELPEHFWFLAVTTPTPWFTYLSDSARWEIIQITGISDVPLYETPGL